MAAWSGLWNDVAGNPAGHSLLVDKNPRRNPLRRFANREGSRKTKELFDSLIGAASGGAAAASHKRVAEASDVSAGASGGVRTIETVTDINRNTAAADVTALKEMTVNVSSAPANYAADLSGNGGPAT